MTTGSTGSIFPKWQLAVIIGAPLAIGLGYLLYRKQSELDGESVDNEAIGNGDKKSLKNLKGQGQTISLDGDDRSIDDNKSVTEEMEKTSKPVVEQISVPHQQTVVKDEPVKYKTPLDEAQKWKNDGNARFKRGRFDEAIEYYDKAIELCPVENSLDLSTFYQNRAAAYEQLKKWANVKDDCTKALELNPRYVKALHRRAKAYEYTKCYMECLEDVTATCILEGFQNSSTLVFADRILKEIGHIDMREAMKTRQPVIPSKNYVKAFFASYVNDPINKIVIASSSPTGFIRAKLALVDNQYDDIIPACTEEIESSESDAEYKSEALLLRGTFYLLCGCFKESESDLSQLINNPETDTGIIVNALIKRAALNIQNDKIDRGFEDFRLAEEKDPENADLYHQRGQVYILQERLEEAIIQFRRAIELEPDQGVTYVQGCYAEYRYASQQKNTAKLLSVMNDFQNAIQKYPKCVECYSIMGQVLTEQGQYAEADTFFEKAMALAPENGSLYVHRGIMHLQWNGDITKAVGYMYKGMECDSKCELVYETLGTIEVQRGNLDDAIELFDKALALAKSEGELVHLFSLKNAAVAQLNVSKKFGIDIASISALAAGGM